MNNKQKYYALYDEQMNGFTFVTGESKEEVADYGADWWYDINLDSELEDMEYKYENHYEDIQGKHGDISYEQYEEIYLNEIRLEDNMEYVSDRGFEIKEVSEKVYNILNEIDWHESRIHDYELDELCSKELVDII